MKNAFENSKKKGGNMADSSKNEALYEPTTDRQTGDDCVEWVVDQLEMEGETKTILYPKSS